jgi:hypothetical protein
MPKRDILSSAAPLVPANKDVFNFEANFFFIRFLLKTKYVFRHLSGKTWREQSTIETVP